MENAIFLGCFGKGVWRAVHNGDGQWDVTRTATEHSVTCLAADPARRQRLYAGTKDGVLRSDDGGLTWLRSGMDGHVVKSLAVSPHDHKMIYAGTKPALMFASRDGGQSWAELEEFRRIPFRWWWFSPAEPPDLRPYVIAISVSPTDPNVVLAGVEFGAVVRSDNGGQTWSGHRKGALRDCHSLTFHTTNGNWVYEAGGTGGGAAFSRDGGRTFQKAGRGLAKPYGIVCAADPERPEIWYICVAPSPVNAFGASPEIYLYRGTAGASWQPIGWQSHPLPVPPTALVTVPGSSGELYAGLSNGHVWHTPDYGDNWAQLPFHFHGVWHSLLVL